MRNKSNKGCLENFSHPLLNKLVTKKTKKTTCIPCFLDILDLKDSGAKIGKAHRYISVMIDNFTKFRWPVLLKKTMPKP